MTKSSASRRFLMGPLRNDRVKGRTAYGTMFAAIVHAMHMPGDHARMCFNG